MALKEKMEIKININIMLHPFGSYTFRENLGIERREERKEKEEELRILYAFPTTTNYPPSTYWLI